ncbi:protein-(glutamine-N5) methyltransferase, release factor-specific [Erythrobacter sp. QSSC1-22B]|uniref:peptide chain release factor N(5)-glutamine methyltransferase n=1 Tax=Erythrobacter sp. QSSC1-22B TaxID=1860125 RepID=UPI0008055A9B|nr:peptide chain release factor N(5)-glutamine methyltransferase [Erythrobacter sp. QSSC1-22B]OBX19767.1 protein-(glutamine-N5) methyltransferase, release factor-specific [Erythrobacter sp. QSSC1-22B]
MSADASPAATSVGAAIRSAAERLAATSDTARLDAELLMAQALGATRSDLLVRHMRDAEPAGFAALIERRARHEPVAHILGRQEFYGLDLSVTPDTLIPRGDSETLIEAARAWFAARPHPARILDLGTGSGALLLAALSLWPEAEGVALDASEPALAVAGDNAAQLGMGDRVTLRHVDWRQPDWAEGLGRFDLVLCNPPYVETDAELAPSVRDHEPAQALFAGAEGLDDYRILIPALRGLMADGALAILEIGAGQADDVGSLASAAGFAAALHHDLAGRPRALLLT